MPRTVINPHFVASQGGYSRDAAITVYDRMQALSAVCVNDTDLARMILARGGTPVLRMGAPEDDDLDARGIKPEEYADAMHNALLVAEAGIAGASLKGIAHVGNEIGSAAPDRTVKWFDVVIRRLTFHRRKACVGNFAIFNPRPELIEKFDKFMPALRENGGELGVHEGLLITPEGEVIDTLLKAAAWGAIGAYRKFMYEYGVRVRVTEFAASKTPLEGYNNWIGTEAFAKLCDDAARVVYAPDGVEFHPYSAFKWDRGDGFEYRDNLTLLNRFAETNRTYEVRETKPMTQPSWQTHDYGKRIDGATARMNANVNIRPEPNENSKPVLGVLKDGDVVTYWDKPYSGGAYLWFKVLYMGLERYVAQVADLRFEAPAVTPDTHVVIYSLAEHDKLLAAVNATQVELDGLKKLLKGAPTSSGGGF